MRLISFLGCLPPRLFILIVGFSGRTGIHDSVFFLCPLPELFWPVYSLSIQLDEIYKISSKSIRGQELSSAFPAKISFLCGLCPSRPVVKCFTVGG